MRRRLDRIVVIDVESTCWEGHPPPGEVSDIIEIGLCTVDPVALTRHDKRALWVEPSRSTVSRFCTELTSITPEMLRGAGSLAEATALLESEYQTRDRLWASWGDYDRRQFERNCRDLGIPYPFGHGHLNIKTLFALVFGLKHEVGIDSAFERLGLTLEGTHHRGVDDAWNIAQLLCLMLKRFRHLG